MSDEHDAMDSLVRTYSGQDPRGPMMDTTEFMADDVIVNHWRWGARDIAGKQAVLDNYFLPHLKAFSDTRAIVHEAIYAPTKLVLRGEYNATFTGRVTSELVGFVGLPPEQLKPHGRPIRWRFHDIFEFEGKEIKRIWLANDTLAVARQMGAIPEDGW